jgi:hypothetical protein
MNTLKRATLVTLVAGSGLVFAMTGAAASTAAEGVNDQSGFQGQSGELDRNSNNQTGDEGTVGDGANDQTGVQGQSGELDRSANGQTGIDGTSGDGANDQGGTDGQSGQSGA